MDAEALRLNGRWPNDLATLMAAMQRESAGDNNLPVVISADAKSTHQSVVTAMDAAGKLGSSTCASPRSRTRRPSPDVVLRATAAAWYQGTRRWRCCVRWRLSIVGWRTAAGRTSCPGASPLPAPPPVLVVGNITVGGTGKTPMILWMIEHCRPRGLRVGVISRGYGARPPTTPWRVRAEQDAAEAG